MKKIHILILIVFFTVSCKFVYQKMILGLKKPRIENEKTITSYLKKHRLNLKNGYLLSDSLYLELITENSKYFSTYEIYNSSHQKIKPSDSLVKKCFGRIDLMLNNLEDSTLWSNDLESPNNLTKLSDNLKLLNGKRVPVNVTSKTKEFFIVFFWTKFMGENSKSYLDIAKGLENSKRENFGLIYINMDKNIFMADSLKELDININIK